MIRSIIDIPLPFMRILNVDWRVDWRGQAPGVGTDGSEQVVYNRLPRFVGAPSLILPPTMIGHWRALVLRAEGRVNAWRVRMLDPAVTLTRLPDFDGDLRAWEAGLYVEPRPQILCPSGAAAGAATIEVDERLASEPVRVGSFLSHDDWPFAVTARSGGGETTTLSVKMLRRAIPAGGAIDLIPRGVFVATSDAMGFPEYSVDRVARPQLDLQEWITR